MRYETVIEKKSGDGGRSRLSQDKPPVSGKSSANKPIKRFPPVLQILTEVDPVVANRLNALVWKGHKADRSLGDICSALNAFARQIGYDPAIGVQEVYTSNMPSYPGETVMTALIMMDLRSTPGSAYGKAG